MRGFAKVVANTFEDFKVHWVNDNVSSISLDKPAVHDHFIANTGTAAGVTWSL